MKHQWRIPISWFCVFFFLLVWQGCAGGLTWVKDQEDGKARIYQASFDKVWRAVSEVVGQLDIKLVDANKKQGYVLAERKTTPVSYGERVTIIITQVDELNTKVKVISKRQYADNLLAINWEQPLLDSLDIQLKQAGLPASPSNLSYY